MLWIIAGAGAQGRITRDLLRAAHPGDEAVFLDDDPTRVGTRLGDTSVVGRGWLAERVGASPLRAVVAIGRNPARLRVAAELEQMGVAFGTVVHPSAVVLGSAVLEPGVVLCPLAVVGSGASVGRHALINTAAVVEHDCTIGPGASLSPGVKMAGRVVIEEGAFVGTGATLNPRVRVGAHAIVASGALVTRDVPPGVLVRGVPAREVRVIDPARDWARLL